MYLVTTVIGSSDDYRKLIRIRTSNHFHLCFHWLVDICVFHILWIATYRNMLCSYMRLLVEGSTTLIHFIWFVPAAQHSQQIWCSSRSWVKFWTWLCTRLRRGYVCRTWRCPVPTTSLQMKLVPSMISTNVCVTMKLRMKVLMQCMTKTFHSSRSLIRGRSFLSIKSKVGLLMYCHWTSFGFAKHNSTGVANSANVMKVSESDICRLYCMVSTWRVVLGLIVSRHQ